MPHTLPLHKTNNQSYLKKIEKLKKVRQISEVRSSSNNQTSAPAKKSVEVIGNLECLFYFNQI